MFRIKIQSKFTKFLVATLLILFVFSRGISLIHNFLHQELNSSETNSLATSHLEQSFFAKLIFAHEKSSDKKFSHCLLCSFSNSQNQITPLANLIFCVAAFYLAFASRKFDRVKLSYLLSSKAPRAPPVIS